MKNFILFSLALLAVNSIALTTTWGEDSHLIQDVHHKYRLSRHLKIARNATKMFSDPDENLTGFFISHDGYLATTLHGNAYECLVHAQHVKPGSETYNKITPPPPEGIPCPKIGLKFASGANNPRLVYVGDFDNLDVAILKFEILQPASCIALSKTEVSNTKRVWVFGFANDGLQSPALASASRGLILKKTDPSYGTFNDANWFAMATHTADGFSGAPVTDGHGRLIGIQWGEAFDGIHPPPYSVATKISAVHDDILKKLGPQKFEEFFNCRSR